VPATCQEDDQENEHINSEGSPHCQAAFLPIHTCVTPKPWGKNHNNYYDLFA
jgi:hypothetical protein